MPDRNAPGASQSPPTTIHDLIPSSTMASDNTAASSAKFNIANIDPIWMSSRTARQIRALSDVEKVCSYSPLVAE